MWCQQFWLQRAWRKQSTQSQVGGREEETRNELENTFVFISLSHALFPNAALQYTWRDLHL